MNKRNNQIIASWVFGGLTFLFLVLVFVFVPHELPAFKQKILAFLAASLAGFFVYFFSGTINMSGKPKIPFIGQLDLKATGGVAVFVLMLFWWYSDFAPIKVQNKSAVVPFIAAEDVHLGDNVYPERWGYNHNPLNVAIYPQKSPGLVFFDKDSGHFLAGTDNQTHIGQYFVNFFNGVVAGLDFSGYSFVSAYDGTGEIPKILKGYLKTGQQHVVKLGGGTLLYANDDGRGNFYERYAAVAVIRPVEFSIPLAQAGMEFTESAVNKVEFLIECYHGGIRPGQPQNFALLLNGYTQEIKTQSMNRREKELVRIQIPLNHINFRQENIAAVFVLPWQEDGPKSLKTGKGPVHFRDIGIVNAYFRVAEN